MRAVAGAAAVAAAIAMASAGQAEGSEEAGQAGQDSAAGAAQGAAFAPTPWNAPFEGPAPVEMPVANDVQEEETEEEEEDTTAMLVDARYGEMMRRGKGLMSAGGITIACGLFLGVIGAPLLSSALEPLSPYAMPVARPQYPVSIALLSAGGMGVVIGAMLMVGGAESKSKAKKLLEGKLTLDQVGLPVVPEASVKTVGKQEGEKKGGKKGGEAGSAKKAGESHDEDGGKEGKTGGGHMLVTQEWIDRQTAIADAGAFMSIMAALLGIGGTVAGVISLSDRVSWKVSDEAIVAAFALHPLSVATEIVGGPLALSAYQRARKVAGVGGRNWLWPLSWTLYTLTVATTPFMFTPLMPLSTGLLVAGAAFTATAGVLARKTLDQTPAWAGQEHEEAAITVLPVVMAVKGGAVVGMAGAF